MSKSCPKHVQNMDACMDACMDTCMDACMDTCIDACMDASIYPLKSIQRWTIQQARLQRRGGPGAASPREHQGSEFCRSTLYGS